MTATLRPGRVQLDGLPGVYDCYLDPTDLWNGFAVPYFTRQALAAIDAAPAGEVGDTRLLFSPDGATAYCWREDVYNSAPDVWLLLTACACAHYPTAQGSRLLWPLGAGELCWSEVAEEE